MVFDSIGKAVKLDDRFSYRASGPGRCAAARRARSQPQTNEIMKLKASKTIGFRPAKELKATL